MLAGDKMMVYNCRKIKQLIVNISLSGFQHDFIKEETEANK